MLRDVAKLCPKCKLPAGTGALRCRECGERLPASPVKFLKELGSYIRSYEVIDWWRFNACVLASLALIGVFHLVGAKRPRLAGICVAAGVIVGLVWQWRNRENL
jgi:hypothetical protein